MVEVSSDKLPHLRRLILEIESLEGKVAGLSGSLDIARSNPKAATLLPGFSNESRVTATPGEISELVIFYTRVLKRKRNELEETYGIKTK